MIIRPGKDSGSKIIYAAGTFTKDDKYVVSQAGGASPFGEALCCPGSDYLVEMSPEGISGSRLGKTTLVSSANINKAWYITDTQSGKLWSAFYNPVCSRSDHYEVRYSPGSARVYNVQNKIACTLTISVSSEHPCEMWHVKLENLSAQDRTLRFITYVEPSVDSPLETRYLEQDRLLLMRRPLESLDPNRPYRKTPSLALFHSSTLPVIACKIDKSEFVGSHRTLSNPMLSQTQQTSDHGVVEKVIGSFAVEIDLPIEGEAEFAFCFGAASSAEECAQIAQSLSKTETVCDAIDAVREKWEKLSSSLHVQTEDRALDALINTWLPYEAYAEWMRKQTEKAAPDAGVVADGLRKFQPFGTNAAYLFREALIDFAGRLSVTGSYHPDEFSQIAMPPGEAIWLAVCAAAYIAETGNRGVLSQTVAFKDGVVMPLGEHCERAIRACANQPNHSCDQLLEEALELWSFVRPSDEFASLLEKVRSRKTSDPKDIPEERSLPRRARYLQSICPTLSEPGVHAALSDELNERTYDARTSLTAYSALVQRIFGITATSEGLVLKPHMPESWFECIIVRQFRGDTYKIHMKRSATLSKKGMSVVVDGEPVLGEMLPFFADGCVHEVDVTVG
ncbi:MAG: hypothetical protein ABFD49_06685 [Armatimonadota bacterium]|nr:hypothetical protein [bacterium]